MRIPAVIMFTSSPSAAGAGGNREGFVTASKLRLCDCSLLAGVEVLILRLDDSKIERRTS